MGVMVGKIYMRCPACNSYIRGNRNGDSYDMDRSYECKKCERYFKFLVVTERGAVICIKPSDGFIAQARLEEIN